MLDLTAALPTFVITLREGVEAALVVGIVLAYLKKANQTRLTPWVYAGVFVGLGLSLLIGLLFSGILAALATSSQPYAPVLKSLLEGTFCLIAIGLLSWMLVWMTQQARSLKAEVEGAIATSLQTAQGAGWGIFSLILIAVLREGFETVLFIAAQVQPAQQSWLPVLGAIAGLIGATLIGFLLFQFGIKINLRQFFQVMGVLLLLIVSGLVVTALRKIDTGLSLFTQLNPAFSCPSLFSDSPSCILGPQVWDTSAILPDRQFPGILLKAFFGYTQNLYALQAIAYLIFLSTLGTLYFRSLNPTPPKTKDSAAPSPSQH
jgi:high-affinity iron transporter